MNPVGPALVVALTAAAVAAGAGLTVPARWRPAVVASLVSATGVAGAVAGIAAVVGFTWRFDAPGLLPLSGVSLEVDALAGWFMLVVGAVTAVVGVYTVGYANRDGDGSGSRTSLAVLPLFVAAMLLVPAAASVPTLLWCWELMAVTSLALVAAEHRGRRAVRSAALWYAAMTQAGFVALLGGLVWAGAVAGDSTFEGIRRAAAAGAMSPVVSGVVFGLCLLGFASKAGTVPVHPWLPRAHAEAPSHVSALMSAAMVKLGLYGLLRVGFDLLGGGPRGWWLVVAAVGGLSALYGVVQAVVATDIKRLLAFTTCENVGLILLGVGFAGMYGSSGRPALAALAMTAALLHVVNHAAFKTALFLGAGSVVKATGTRDLDQLGGLSSRMTVTTILVALGALSAAALPPGNGFVSEWLLLQSLLHPGGTDIALAVVAPVAVAVVALTAGVGAATYVKLLGTGLVARPRSRAAERATESPPSMLTAMGLAVLACAALALVPGVMVPAIGRVTADLGLDLPPVRPAVTGVSLSEITTTFWPLWLAVAVVGGVGVIAVLARTLGRRRRRAAAWDCGDGPLTARMEYTATSYAEPLLRVFDDVLAPERDVDVTHDEESAYHIEAIRFRQRIPDRLENRLYRPLIAGYRRLGDTARWLATGSVHRYLAYMLTALIAVLLTGVLR